MRYRTGVAPAAALLGALIGAGCGATPGGESADTAQQEPQRKVDVAKAGKVSLTVWDQNVRGGQSRQIRALNRAFEERYPNVRIERVAKSFSDLNTTRPLRRRPSSRSA